MPEEKPMVIAISGSTRKGGNTDQFLQATLDIISEYKIQTELITLCDKKITSGCIACWKCRERHAECAINDDVNPIFKKMVQADGIILGCPVYFGSVPAKMKALLERAGILCEGRVSFDKPVFILGKPALWPETSKGPGLFARKIGGAITVARRDGVISTLSELALWFLINNFIVVSSNYWTVGLGTKRVPKADRSGYEHSRDTIKNDLEGRRTIEHFAENFAWLVNLTHEPQKSPEEIFKESRLSSPLKT
jgi:multimeric flavodoxin WrbA